MRTYLLLIAILSWFYPAVSYWEKIHTEIQWKRLEFRFLNEFDKELAISSGRYDPDVPAPVDVDVYYPPGKARMIFVTIPRFGPGVPVTFGLVTDEKNVEDRLIEPFPSWDWQTYEGCPSNRLVSVFRVKIDRCGLLWVLDSGNVGDRIVCKPQLVVFDLKVWPYEKRPYYRYEFPSVVYTNSSIFVTPIVEPYGMDCKAGAFVYVADTTGRAIVVTDLNRKYSWRILDNSMNPEDVFSNFDIANETFFLNDGVLGMDLAPDHYTKRPLFFSPLAGSKQTYMDTTTFKNGGTQPPWFYKYASPRKSQSAAMAISRTGVAFFGLMSSTSINCWNIQSRDYGPYIHTVYTNPETMQFPSGVKVIVNPQGVEELWVLTPRFQKLMNNGYNFNEVNFRISMGYVNDLLMNCKCVIPNH